MQALCKQFWHEQFLREHFCVSNFRVSISARQRSVCEPAAAGEHLLLQATSPHPGVVLATLCGGLGHGPIKLVAGGGKMCWRSDFH